MTDDPGDKRGGSGGRRGATATAGERTSFVGTAFAFVKEVVIVVVLAVVLSLVLKTWFIQSFWIPSGSMNNTLVRDDRVSVSKLTPGLFDLDRGDIVVFEDPGDWLEGTVPPEPDAVSSRIDDVLTWIGLLPNDEGNHLIKRVIGLPGDHVKCCGEDGRILVNGTPITEPYVRAGDNPSDRPFDIRVPPEQLWLMGDHRSDSQDSRFQDAPANDGRDGSVPVDRVVGRAFAIVWPLSRMAWLSTPSEVFANVPAPSGVQVLGARRPVAAGVP